MKVASYSIIHYGKDYLDYAIQSIYDTVDSVFVFYTPHPSHGHKSNLPRLESRKEILKSISKQHFPKLIWIDCDQFWDEGPQRDFAVQTLIDKGADLITVLDYDEVWQDGQLQKCLDYVWQENKAQKWLMNMLHFYRSFDEACSDNMWPIRILDTRHNEGTGYLSEFGKVLHFGYATTDDTIHYKWTLHGHLNEMRTNWQQEKWLNYQKGITKDVHPTCENTWKPEPFNKFDLPDYMHLHPFFGRERIE